MKKLLSSIVFLTSYIFTQDICSPWDLETTSLNNSIQLDWADIGNNITTTNIFLECFESCDYPETATISHSIDNGTGGWFRGDDGSFYCGYGPDCMLNTDEIGFSAIAGWSTDGIPVDSRMIFGPFLLPLNSIITLDFFESYMAVDWADEHNLVEISIDSGLNWQTIYSSNAETVGNELALTTLDLTEFSGENIDISFRYISNTGDAEAWLVDHVNINSTSNDNNTSPIVGSWILDPVAGSMMVGPSINSSDWWYNSPEDVIIRACQFDDLYIFNADGSFQNDFIDNQTWLEPWQSGGYEQCGVPVAPHDGSSISSWELNEENGVLTLNGMGAFIGLAKVVNEGELPVVSVPESISYIATIEDDNMTLNIEAGAGVHWTFKLIKNSESITNRSIEENDFHQSFNMLPRFNNLEFDDKKIKRRTNRNGFKPKYFPTFIHNRSDSNTPLEEFESTRECVDPENESEVTITCTPGSFPSEISWVLRDSLSGQEIMSGVAPYEQTLCLANGWYILQTFDSYGDGWNGAFLSINDARGQNYLDFSLLNDSEGSITFYVGPIYGCMDPFADNFNPAANTDDGSCEYVACEENLTYFFCSPGDWPSEVSWQVQDSLGSVVAFGVTGIMQSACLQNGYYKVIGFDSFGDGWNNAIFTAYDTTGSSLVNFTLNFGALDSATFYVGPIYGCTDPQADNFNPSATIDDGSCLYADCHENQGYIVYLDGDSADFTNLSSYSFNNLTNGILYNLGVAAVYDEGISNITYQSSVPWNNVVFDPLVIEIDTLGNENFLEQNFTFYTKPEILFTTPFSFSSPNKIDIDYETSLLYSDFNSNSFTTMFDPSGIFGGLWTLGNSEDASSLWFQMDQSIDSTNFVWINDDALADGSGAQSAYLATDQVQINNSDRVIVTFDLFFPQFAGSCAGGTGGQGFGEELHFMISTDFGNNWTMIDSTMGGTPNWISKMYDITDKLNNEDTFMAALYYTDCEGNWSWGVAIDNFAIHIADQNEILVIDPYRGWIDFDSPMQINLSIPRNEINFSDTQLDLTAAFETFSIPIHFGLTLDTEKNNIITPNKFVLHQNYPNPFNPSTNITFEIPNNSFVEINIYNLKGQKIKTLLNQQKIQGLHQIIWNGHSDHGRPMPAGLYLYEVKTERFFDSKKMILLK